MKFNNIAIIEGSGDFIDGASVLKALQAGVTHFVEGTEAVEETGTVIASKATSEVEGNNGYRFDIDSKGNFFKV